MQRMLDLRGHRFLVTGASSGLGQETAVLLSEMGASLLVTGRDQKRLAETSARLKSEMEHKAEVLDLTGGDEVARWFADQAKQLGPFDGFAHCAGEEITLPLRGIGRTEFDRLFHLNVEAAFQLIKAYRQTSVHNASGGSIVLVSSVVGLLGSAGLTLYSATKAALLGLTRSAALELAGQQIRINAVAPGQFEGSSRMAAKQKSSLTPEQYRRIGSMHPLGLGTPQDVAPAIAFLLSPAAKWMTGTVLTVDGGYSAH